MTTPVLDLWRVSEPARSAPLLAVADAATPGASVLLMNAVLLAGLVGAVVTVVRVRVWRPATLRRGPERRLDLTHADRVIGAGLVGMIVIGAVMGARVSDAAADPAAAQAAAMVSSLGLIGSAVFFLVKAWQTTPAGLRSAGLLPRRPGRDLVVGLAGFVVGTLFTWATLAAVAAAARAGGSDVPEVNHTLLEQLGREPTLAAVTQLVGIAVLMGPLLEEVVFRGLLQTLLIDTLGRRFRWTAVLIAAAVFALIHAGAVSWHGWPGLFVLGLVLGWLYERTGSLLPCYLAHALFNAANIAMAVGMSKATAG